MATTTLTAAAAEIANAQRYQSKIEVEEINGVWNEYVRRKQKPNAFENIII